MGRHAQHTHTLADGTEVGYSLTDRPGGYRVRFLGPDGKRLERATGCQTKGEARDEARRLIDVEYRPGMPAAPTESSWEKVLADIGETPDLRANSVKNYQKALRALRRAFPELRGPAGVTPALAHRFKNLMLSGTYARGRASDAARYRRSPTS
jgi:hypothetical protein